MTRAYAKLGGVMKADLLARLSSFVVERHPFAFGAVEPVLQQAAASTDAGDPEALRARLKEPLRQALSTSFRDLPEPTPRVSVLQRQRQAIDELLDAVDGFLHREAITASLTLEEKREMLRGMILTRAVDLRLKAFFSGGEVRYGQAAFQGKGFRSLGQEAIYAAALRLRRGAAWRSEDGRSEDGRSEDESGAASWRGDVVGPLIRDLGAALCMRPEPLTVRMVLKAQMGKAGGAMSGKDLHIGDFGWGILPATAPLSISTTTIAGIGMAMARQGDGRVAVSFIGEGGTSLGEWHEAINLCAVHRLPVLFCVQNNQTALSTPVAEQSQVRVFADKASGYGIPGITLDGTDPEAIVAAFTWAAERARQGAGPALLELVAMRMCGHAHHDDMLYLGKEPPSSWQSSSQSSAQSGWDYPPLQPGGYANPDAYAYWRQRDPIAQYAERLREQGLLADGELEQLRREAEELVEREARAVIEAPWPAAQEAGQGVDAEGPIRRHVEILEQRRAAAPTAAELPPLEPGLPVDPKGSTLLEAVMLGVGDALRGDARTFVYGEDVGGAYGNAFLLLRPLLDEFGDRIVNAPLAEGGILGACIGAALAGLRPIGEIQFNDFVASGFNQLVNNAAKIRYRWGGEVPMVVRMPWGGLRRAGPYHSQNTEAWFYRTPGLKIVAPSTPEDARALLAAAVADPDPVLYYEHIALYREPRIKQRLEPGAPEPLPLGKAALRRAGSDLALISYGAYVHHCLRVADRLAADGIEAAVLDLRSLVPLDRDAVLAVAGHTGKVLIAHEDTRTGGIGESLAAQIQEEVFEFLDAPVRVLGSLDTPVPYAPPLEDAFLLQEAQIEDAARLLAAY